MRNWRRPGARLAERVTGRLPSSRARVDRRVYFYHSRNVDTNTAVQSLAALAQDSRLELFRHLVQAGPEGVAAGELAERLGIPASTLSFHMKTLSRAGLIDARHESRFIYYSANFDAMNALLAFLSDNCCGGRSCAPTAKPPRANGAQRSKGRER